MPDLNITNNKWHEFSLGIFSIVEISIFFNLNKAHINSCFMKYLLKEILKVIDIPDIISKEELPPIRK